MPLIDSSKLLKQNAPLQDGISAIENCNKTTTIFMKVCDNI